MKNRMAWLALVVSPIPLASSGWSVPGVVGILLFFLSRVLFCAGLLNPCDIIALIGLGLVIFSQGHLIVL